MVLLRVTALLLLAVAPAGLAATVSRAAMTVAPAGVLGSPVTGLPTVATWADTVTGPMACTYDRLSGAYLFVAWCDTSPHIRTTTPSDLTTAVSTVTASATSATWVRVTLECNGYTDDGYKTVWWAGEIDGARDDLVERELLGDVGDHAGAIGHQCAHVVAAALGSVSVFVAARLLMIVTSVASTV